MKLIVTGASRFIATEVIRLALSNPRITSLIALARSPIIFPKNTKSGTNFSKLKSVVLEDWISPYPLDVTELIKDADACI
jgi:hypothetical protein